MPQEKQYKREVAGKTSISRVLEAGEGLLAGRVNILATVVDKESEGQYPRMVVDDGTGQLRLRFFDNAQQLFEKASIGDFILLIGKPRRYAQETYIAPEIIKVVNDVKWAEVRKLELRTAKPEAEKEKAEDIRSETNDADIVSKDKLELYRIIKELDSGRGADVGEVAAKFGGNSDSLIREMIKNGDIFEVLPGRLKVLE